MCSRQRAVRAQPDFLFNVQEPEHSTSSSELPAALDDTANSSAAPAQPKKKGKKALNAAIERRKEKESYDGREVDMSAYKPIAQQAANAPAASPAPIATPEPKQDAVKVSPLSCMRATDSCLLQPP